MSAASTVPRLRVTMMSVAKVLGLLCVTVNTKVSFEVPSTAVASVAVIETTGLSPSSLPTAGSVWLGVMLSSSKIVPVALALPNVASVSPAPRARVMVSASLTSYIASWVAVIVKTGDHGAVPSGVAGMVSAKPACKVAMVVVCRTLLASI